MVYFVIIATFRGQLVMTWYIYRSAHPYNSHLGFALLQVYNISLTEFLFLPLFLFPFFASSLWIIHADLLYNSCSEHSPLPGQTCQLQVPNVAVEPTN